MKKQVFPIVGMHCASCKALIEKVVGRMEGIKSVKVSYGSEKMVVEYDEQKVSIEDIKKTVASAGSYELIYDPQKQETVFGRG